MSYYFLINFHSKEKEQLVLKTFLFGCNKRFRAFLNKLYQVNKIEKYSKVDYGISLNDLNKY